MNEVRKLVVQTVLVVVRAVLTHCVSNKNKNENDNLHIPIDKVNNNQWCNLPVS